MPDVHVLDLHFMGSNGVIAAHAIPTSDGLVLVDCGPGSTLAGLRSSLQTLGFGLSDVRHVLLTHVHLDHAGAAGKLAKDFGVQIYVHRHGAKHMEHPERLLESAARIYGAMMEPLWGEFLPVPAERLRVLEGGENLGIGGQAFRAIHTPGHAIHHLAFALEGHVFCGDVGGVRLPGAGHVLAPTPPPDIDFAEWRESIGRLRACHASHLHLAHFGVFTDVRAHLDRLERSIGELEALSLEVLRAGGDTDEIARRIKAMAALELRHETDRTLQMRYELSTPYGMAAAGLMRYWRKHHPEALED